MKNKMQRILACRWLTSSDSPLDSCFGPSTAGTPAPTRTTCVDGTPAGTHTTRVDEVEGARVPVCSVCIVCLHRSARCSTGLRHDKCAAQGSGGPSRTIICQPCAELVDLLVQHGLRVVQGWYEGGRVPLLVQHGLHMNPQRSTFAHQNHRF